MLRTGDTYKRLTGDVSLVFGGAEPSSEDDDTSGGDGEDDSQNTSSGRNGQCGGTSDCDGYGPPCGSRGYAVLADGIVIGELEDAWGGRGKEDEESDREEDGSESTDELSEVLGNGLGSNEMTSLQVTSEIGSLGSGTGSDHTREQVDSESVHVVTGDGINGVDVLAVGGTSHDELGSLGAGRDWVDVGDTSGENTNEGKDKGEDDGEDGEADIDSEADTLDDAGDGDGDEGDGNPDPPRNLVLLWCGVDLGSLLELDGRESLAGTELVADVVDGGVEAGSDGAPFDSQLDKGRDQHDQDTDPEEIVSWGSGGTGRVTRRHAVVAAVGDVAVSLNIAAGSTSGSNECRSDDCPSEDGSTVEGERSVGSGKDTGTEEGRSDFVVPTPVVEVLSLWCSPYCDPVEEMPVVEDTWDVGGGGLLEEADQEGVEEPLALDLGVSCTGAGSMKRADGVSSGRRSGESETLAENEEGTEGHGESHSVECSGHDKSDELANVLLGRAAEETDLVHGGESRDEQYTETTSGSSGRLSSDVFLGTKVSGTAVNSCQYFASSCKKTPETHTQVGRDLGRMRESGLRIRKPPIPPSNWGPKVKPVFRPRYKLEAYYWSRPAMSILVKRESERAELT